MEYSRFGGATVLFTSAGRRVELLRAFRDAFRTLRIDGRSIALDINPLAPTLQVADVRYVVPRLTSDEYLPTLERICEKERVDLVIPLIDPDIAVLAANRARIEATGARLAVVPEDAVRTTGDKWITREFFQRLELRTPMSWLAGEGPPPDAGFPLFIKPRGGSASEHTFKIRNEEELRFFSEYVPCPIIQEFLPGPEITTDVVCGLDATVLGMVSRQRLEVRSGEVAKGVTVHIPEILEGCRRIAEALPACGPITVQCMMRDGVPFFTEINARFGGGVPLGIAAGIDAPALLLAHALGLQLDTPEVGAYRTGLYVTRFDDSFLLTETDREQVASDRL